MTVAAFQAYGTAPPVTALTPRDAALAYFAKHPKARKCNVISGTMDAGFFTIRYGRSSVGNWPTSYKNVTPKTAGDLPA